MPSLSSPTITANPLLSGEKRKRSQEDVGAAAAKTLDNPREGVRDEGNGSTKFNDFLTDLLEILRLYVTSTDLEDEPVMLTPTLKGTIRSHPSLSYR